MFKLQLEIRFPGESWKVNYLVLRTPWSNAHPIPTPQNHNHHRASNASPCQAWHSPVLKNDFSHNPLLHHQRQSPNPNIFTCNTSRNDLIIPANGSYWLPNISYCTMSGERASFQCSGDLGLPHNTPYNQASQPTQPSHLECASPHLSQSQSQNNENNNGPLI